MWPQLGADAVQMKPRGPPISRSSKLPTRTTMASGRLDDSLNSGVPHLGQKRRRIMLPLSAVLTYSATSPVKVKLAVLKIALTEALPVARYWQSRHQQARTAIGGSSKWKRTAPQKHRPVTRLAISDLLGLPGKVKPIAAAVTIGTA